MSDLKAKAARRRRAPARTAHVARDRILVVALNAFAERGYSGASTLEIATRARVSKRELYALFGNKHALLTACIVERAKQIRLAADLPAAESHAGLAGTLAAFGGAILKGVSEPDVLAVYRLAVSESERSPEIARVLVREGRETQQAALAAWFARAKQDELIGSGNPATMASDFLALLWGDLLVGLLLRVIDPPSPKDMERRARGATEALLALYGAK